MPTLTLTEVDHPLSLPTVDEISAFRKILDEKGLIADNTGFVYAGLEEPDKADVYGPRVEVDRQFRVLLHDIPSPGDGGGEGPLPRSTLPCWCAYDTVSCARIQVTALGIPQDCVASHNNRRR